MTDRSAASHRTEGALRNPPLLADDLRRLEAHYKAEAERLRKEARTALACASECKQWRKNLQQQQPSGAG